MPKQSAIIVQQAEVSADPATPPAGYSIIYPRTDGKWYAKNAAGVVVEVTNVAGGSASNIARTLLTPATSEVIATNTAGVTYGFYQITGILSLTINGNGKFLIL